MKLAHKTITNSIASFAGFFSLTISTFIITPYTLMRLEDAQYGIYAIFFSVIGLLNILDFGLAYSSIRFITEALEKKNYKNITTITNMNVWIFLSIGILLVIIVMLLLDPIVHLINVPDYLISKTKIGLILAICSVPVFLVMGVYAAVLQAHQKLLMLNSVVVMNSIIFTITTFVALYYSPTLPTLMALNIANGTLMLMIYFFITKRLVPGYTINFAFDKELFNKIFSFAGHSFIILISVRMLFQIDKLIISRLLGPTQVTYYTLPSSISTKVQGIIANINNILFPLTASLSTREKSDELITLYQKATTVNAIGLASMCVPLFVYSDQIIGLWLGEQYVDPSGFLLKLALVGYALYSLTSVPASFLAGLNFQKQNMYFFLSICLSNIILLILLVPKYHLLGAALAFIFAHWPVVLQQRYCERKINAQLLPQIKMYSKTLLLCLIAGIPMYLTISYISTIWILLVVLIIAGVSMMLLSSIFILNTEDRKTYLSYVKNFILTLKNYQMKSF